MINSLMSSVVNDRRFPAPPPHIIINNPNDYFLVVIAGHALAQF